MNEKVKIILGIIIIIILILVVLLISNTNNQNDTKNDSNTTDIYGIQTETYVNNPGDYQELNYENKPVVNKDTQENNSGYTCTIGNSYDIVQGEYTITAEMVEKTEGKCKVIATLTRAPGFEGFLIGTNATCYLTDNELNNLNASTDISKLSCEGYLYELAKAR